VDRDELRPFVALLVTQFAFASLAVVGKVVLHGLPPLVVAGIRVFVASLFLVLIAFAPRRERVSSIDLAKLLVFALLGVVINQVLFLEGLSRTSAVNASILIATIPVFTTAIAILSRRERARPARIVGILVAFGGALVILRIERFDLGEASVLGNLMIVANALSYSFYLVFSRPLLHKYRSPTVVAWTFLFGALLVAPIGAWKAADVDFSAVPSAVWWGMVWVVLVPSVLAYSLNNYALKRLHSSTVAAWAFLQPLIGVALALIFLRDETLSPRAMLGGILVIAGVLIVSRLERYEPMGAIAESGEAMSRKPFEAPDGRAQSEPQEDRRRREREEAP
jgi:drug/metabolite transporter (DMT)-like permease